MQEKEIVIKGEPSLTKDQLLSRIKNELDKELPTDVVSESGPVSVSVRFVSQQT